MQQQRRKKRGYVLWVGAAVAAVALSLGGVLWWSQDERDPADGRPGPSSAAQPPARIACAKNGQLPGSGSTAQQNAMKRWIAEYQRACPGVQVAYNPMGSGAGVAQFLRAATAFGGSDGALKPDEVELSKKVCPGGRAIDLPLVGGPIAIGYYLEGVDDLVLDAPTLARIFNSEITKWDDPAIRKLNPHAKLPSLTIRPMHRADSSGTTENLNAYLSEAAPGQWPHPVRKTWQGKGGESADGSDGVASQVNAAHGAIGYFELSFAVDNRMPTVRIDTGATEPVAPSPTTASAGIAAAHVAGRGRDMSLDFDYGTDAEGAYPLVLVTYELVCDKGNQAETLPALKSFLTYAASEDGQRILPGIHYAPLPDKVATRVREVIGTLS